MGISEKEKEAIIQIIGSTISGKLKIFLYGSRSRGKKSDGDIDILVLSETPVPYETIRKIKIRFSDLIPDAKLDIVVSTFSQKSAFVKLIEDTAILLWERT
jgi:predicted nucleotidyltransferase